MAKMCYFWQMSIISRLVKCVNTMYVECKQRLKTKIESLSIKKLLRLMGVRGILEYLVHSCTSHVEPILEKFVFHKLRSTCF